MIFHHFTGFRVSPHQACPGLNTGLGSPGMTALSNYDTASPEGGKRFGIGTTIFWIFFTQPPLTRISSVTIACLKGPRSPAMVENFFLTPQGVLSMRYSIYPKHPFNLPKKEDRLISRSASLCLALGTLEEWTIGIMGRPARLQAGEKEFLIWINHFFRCYPHHSIFPLFHLSRLGRGKPLTQN